MMLEEQAFFEQVFIDSFGECGYSIKLPQMFYFEEQNYS